MSNERRLHPPCLMQRVAQGLSTVHHIRIGPPTCPREAAASGAGLIDAKTSAVGLPRDASTVFKACRHTICQSCHHSPGDGLQEDESRPLLAASDANIQCAVYGKSEVTRYAIE